jgi:hypothetical protein
MKGEVMQLAGNAFAISCKRWRALACFFFTITTLFAACVHASTTAVPDGQPAQISPARQAIAQFK